MFPKIYDFQPNFAPTNDHFGGIKMTIMNDECENRKKELDENEKMRRRYVSKIDPEYLLPRSRAKGMREFIGSRVFHTGQSYYADYVETMETHGLKPGGYLDYDAGEFMHPAWMTWHDYDWYDATMRAYDKFLCSDGRIRYRPSEESDAKYEQLLQEAQDERWRQADASFRSVGMFYDDEKGYWINPETGETGCY